MSKPAKYLSGTLFILAGSVLFGFVGGNVGVLAGSLTSIAGLSLIIWGMES